MWKKIFLHLYHRNLMMAGCVGDMPPKNTMNSQLRNKKGNLNKEPCGFTGACYSKRKRGGNTNDENCDILPERK